MRVNQKRLRSIWTDMHRRCEVPSRADYQWYGARGISVCEEWSSFENFASWSMSHGYGEDLTLDRERNEGNYEPSNCRWVTVKHQERNRRNNDVIEFIGIKKCLSEWAEDVGISQAALWNRIYKLGWSIEKSLCTPVRVYGGANR